MSSDFSATTLISVSPFQYEGFTEDQYPIYGSMGTNQISAADFNNDGNIDLVTSNRLDKSISVLFNDFCLQL